MAICFSVKTASEQCALSARTLHAAIKRGDLKVMRVGRRVLITPAALEDYLRGNSGKSRKGIQ